MRSIFEPRGWTVNKVEHDYGIDFDVEAFRDNKCTGASFKAQLKSSNSTRYSASGDFVSQQLDLGNARHLCTELRTPVLLVHADVEHHRTFWSAPQLDLKVMPGVTRSTKAASITLRIPTANELPATITQLVESVAQVESILATRVLISTPAPDFVATISGHFPKEQVIQDLKDKADALKLDEAQTLFRADKIEDAAKIIEKILTDTESSIPTKFSALLTTELIRTTALYQARAPQADIPKLHIEISRQLQELAKKGPQELKFFALLARKVAELDDLVHTDWGLYLNWKAHETKGDAFWRLRLVFERTRVIRRIATKYNQCLRLGRYAANSNRRWGLPEALLRIPPAVGILIIRLRQEGLNEAADRYSASALQICKLAAWIAVENGNERALVSAASAAFMTTRDATSDAVEWAKQTIAQIRDSATKKDAEYLFDRHMQRIKGEKVEGDIEATIQQVVENMATGLGIDLANPNDRVAELVRIGIADSDPSRVLKNCERIFITLGSYPIFSPTAFVVGALRLSPAGPKIIHCDLHRYAVPGPTLDGTYVR